MDSKYNIITVNFLHEHANIGLMVTAEVIPPEPATRTEPGCAPMINDMWCQLIAAPNAELVDFYALGLEDELTRRALELACD